MRTACGRDDPLPPPRLARGRQPWTQQPPGIGACTIATVRVYSRAIDAAASLADTILASGDPGAMPPGYLDGAEVRPITYAQAKAILWPKVAD